MAHTYELLHIGFGDDADRQYYLRAAAGELAAWLVIYGDGQVFDRAAVFVRETTTDEPEMERRAMTAAHFREKDALRQTLRQAVARACDDHALDIQVDPETIVVAGRLNPAQARELGGLDAA